ncbi:hypothetical protein QLQ12_01290 [Actinoplanes sp. NEAU-A12]|uniref:Helicase C-terminal domain-containing protein n=1 Tax=Actinoplanes sandaracinus TaxID=3045177 RepID=A0ABT6WBZ1_9ACTN|nr:hypothetical protein [Actinoplanes sandaracinus]MDI6097243.1 hypothetical protein [Actinoplanes sandaracinus]
MSWSTSWQRVNGDDGQVVRIVQRPAHVHLACEPQSSGSLSSAAGEAPKVVLCPARVPSLSDAELDALVAEAVVDCYDEHEQLSGLFAMIEGDLAVPFEAEVLGVAVVVRKVDLRSSGIVASCHREAKVGDGILVIGTTPFIGEGFDAPVLDTLFLAGPISFDGLLVQCAGRVIRAASGKDVAEVHDYHDPATPILAVSLQRRMPGYRALGFVRP